MDTPRIAGLKGPDRVRKRPGVVFGSDGLEGTVAMIRLLVDVFLTEAVLGYCRKIKVTIHPDDSVSIFSADRGLAIEERLVDGKPAWQHIFCELGVAPREPDEEYFLGFGRKHNGLYGDPEAPLLKAPMDTDHCFDLCCAQYVSEYMHVEATRDGTKKTLEFRNGYSVSDVKTEPSCEDSHTYIRFKPDPTVFKDIHIAFHSIGACLREAAITIAGLECELQDERTGEHARYRFDNGLLSYIDSILEGKMATPLYIKEKEAVGRDRYNKREYAAHIRLAFCFAQDLSRIECYHNSRKLERGGLHFREVKKEIVQSVCWACMCEGEDAPDPKEFDFEDIADTVLLLVETSSTNCSSNWEDITKTAIHNQMIADMAVDLLGEDFRYYLKKHGAAFLKAAKRAAFERKAKAIVE